MNSPLADLALRKQLLLARSSLCRLEIRHDVEVVRDSLTWRNTAIVAARSPTVRSAAFLLATEVVGHDRMAHFLAYAGRALAFTRLVRVAIELVRTPPGGAEDPQQL